MCIQEARGECFSVKARPQARVQKKSTGKRASNLQRRHQPLRIGRLPPTGKGPGSLGAAAEVPFAIWVPRAETDPLPLVAQRWRVLQPLPSAQREGPRARRRPRRFRRHPSSVAALYLSVPLSHPERKQPPHTLRPPNEENRTVRRAYPAFF